MQNCLVSGCVPGLKDGHYYSCNYERCTLDDAVNAVSFLKPKQLITLGWGVVSRCWATEHGPHVQRLDGMHATAQVIHDRQASDQLFVCFRRKDEASRKSLYRPARKNVYSVMRRQWPVYHIAHASFVSGTWYGAENSVLGELMDVMCRMHTTRRYVS